MYAEATAIVEEGFRCELETQTAEIHMRITWCMTLCARLTTCSGC